jgi:hypothetical protein
MACKRSAVRSRLAPPVSNKFFEVFFRPASPSSRGLGHHPFTVRTGVRIPVGTPIYRRSVPGTSFTDQFGGIEVIEAALLLQEVEGGTQPPHSKPAQTEQCVG